MNAHILYLVLFVFFSVTLQAQQTQALVVKTNGDSLYFDKITAGGKFIVCESAGTKTKLKASEVSYYIETYTWYISDADPPPTKDTTRKCFVADDGLIHEVIIENDSFYLTFSAKKKSNSQWGSDVENYHIMKKNHDQASLVTFDKTVPDLLLKYFGGTCQEFDTKVKAAKPKFNNRIFPRELFFDLLDFYSLNCRF